MTACPNHHDCGTSIAFDWGSAGVLARHVIACNREASEVRAIYREQRLRDGRGNWGRARAEAERRREMAA